MGGNPGPLVYAYVDETGDRGMSASSSRWFAMVGVAVASEDLGALRAAVATCRARLTVPPGKALHWSEHVKTFSRRQFTMEQFALLPLVANYVVFEKAAIPATSVLRTDHTTFYNHVAGLMMDRLLLTAKYWPGGERPVAVKFAHVRGFDHTDTLAHLGARQAKAKPRIPWRLRHGRVEFPSTGQHDGLQVADLYAGALKAAIVPDSYAGYEQHHLLRTRHQIRRYQGKAWGVGLKVLARPGTLESLPWWMPNGVD